MIPVSADNWAGSFMTQDEFLAKHDLTPDTREETVRLAIESARRWATRTDLSPETRLRRVWTVLVTALEEA